MVRLQRPQLPPFLPPATNRQDGGVFNMLVESPEERLEFHKHEINYTITQIQKLLESAAKNSKAADFYTVMEQAMFALGAALHYADITNRSYTRLETRVLITENLVKRLLIKLDEKALANG